MYLVHLTGPETVLMPILDAENKEEAKSIALNGLGMFLHKFEKPYTAGQFKVDDVTGPEDIPE